MTKIPHGGRCLSCSKLLDNCSSLDFKSMRAMGKPDKEGVVMVMCTQWEKNKHVKDKL